MSTNESFHINGENIAVGENKVFNVHIARLPSNTPIHISMHVFRSTKAGPTLLVTGGVHGDEVNGVEIVRRCLVQNLFENLLCGSVIAIPIVNVYGFINFSRDLPDGKDVNRSFPGTRGGSLASRVAQTLSKTIIPLIDYGIDFHTGSASRHNYPQVRYTAQDNVSEQLAHIFAPSCLIPNNPIPKSFRLETGKQGKSMLVFEGGEALRYNADSIQQGMDGLKRVMQHLGMIAEAPPPPSTSLKFRRTSWLRSPRSGLFLWHKNSGNYVAKGETIGEINSPDGDENTSVVAHKSGFIFGHNNSPIVSQGDALFHIGYDEEMVRHNTNCR